MQFNSVQSGSFLTGAKSVNENVTDIYNTAIQTGFNADQVIKQSNANDAVKQMATARRQASMANTAITSSANNKVEDIKRKLPGELKDIRRPAVRMEGINRMAGSVAAGAYIMDESKLAQKEANELKKYRTSMLEQQKALMEENAESDKQTLGAIRAMAEKLGAKFDSNGNPIFNSSTSLETSPTISPSSSLNNTSAPVLPSSASSNSSNPSAKQVFDYMKSKGLSDIHAKGILANIKGESGFQTGIMGDSGTSGGLFQMHDPEPGKGRFTNMVTAVPNWRTNWKGQIDHGLKDDTAPQYLNIKFDSPVQAANWFLHNYERPSKEHRPGREQLNQSFISSLTF